MCGRQASLSAKLLTIYQQDDLLKGDELCKVITEELFSRVLSRQKSEEILESQIIIRELISHKHASPSELIYKATDKNKMDKVIQKMIAENIIRYDAKGNVKWFGKLQEEEVSKMKIPDGNKEHENSDDENKGHEKRDDGNETKDAKK